MKGKWVVELDRKPMTFLPANIDRTGWIETSAAGDEWAVFYDPATDTTHRCSAYRKVALEERGLGDPAQANH